MSEKSVVKVTKRKTRKTAMAELDSSAVAVLEQSSVKADSVTMIGPANRQALVAAEAYFFAERRGFSGGNEVEDWVAAERLVDSWLNRSLNS
jgi:Protein of unknown function (DUF2934)